MFVPQCFTQNLTDNKCIVESGMELEKSVHCESCLVSNKTETLSASKSQSLNKHLANHENTLPG